MHTKKITTGSALGAGIVLGSLVMMSGIFAAPQKAELAFAEVSKAGGVVGSMVPASCSSSASPNPQPLFGVGTGNNYNYYPYGYLENADLYHAENYVANCTCGNGATNFPTCTPMVKLNFAEQANPHIDSFTGPETVRYNSRPYLRWQSTDAAYCTGSWRAISGDKLAADGGDYGGTVRTTSGVKHTLTCFSADGLIQTAPQTLTVFFEPDEW